MTASIAPLEEITITDAARVCYERSEGDIKAATEALEERVRGSDTLYRDLLDPLVRVACYDAISALIRSQRRKVWEAPRLQVAGDRNVISFAQSRLMDFPLPGGKRLGDATRTEVTAAAEFFSKQASDMSHKAKWLEAVAQSVTGKKKVADVLTEDRLAALRDELK